MEPFESRKKRGVNIQDPVPVCLNYLTSQKPEIACKQKKVRIILFKDIQNFPIIFSSVPPLGSRKTALIPCFFCTFERISIGFVRDNRINYRVFFM